MSTAVLALDGVLRTWVAEGVIDSGTRLYHGLKTSFRLAVLSDDVSVERDKHWLDSNGFTEHPYLAGTRITDPENKAERRLVQIQRLRAAGCAIGFVVEPDPEVAAELLRNGISVFLALHPEYARPEFRPDYRGAVVPWEALVSEVDRQRSLSENDTRNQEIL